MFDKAGGDSTAANLKHFAKDLRHLVMLNGFSLQESVNQQVVSVPIATVPTSPQGLSPGQPNFRPGPLNAGLVRPTQPSQTNVQRPPHPFGILILYFLLFSHIGI